MKTYNVLAHLGTDGGGRYVHVLASLTINKRGELHHADADWSRKTGEGIEFASQGRAEAVALLVLEWGLCDVVEVVEASA